MRNNAGLWVAQALLALLFLFAGGVKLVLPLDALAGPLALPGPFIRFVGVCEVAGALGLVLPGLLRIRVGLTSLAAAGLAVLMAGATVVTAMAGGLVPAFFPAAVGALAAFVAFGRSRVNQPERASGGRQPLIRPSAGRTLRAGAGTQAL